MDRLPPAVPRRTPGSPGFLCLNASGMPMLLRERRSPPARRVKFSEHICSSKCRSCQGFKTGQSHLVIEECLRVFEFEIEQVGEIRERVNELVSVRCIGVECGAISSVRLGNETISVFLEQILVAGRLDVIFLDLCELLLQVCIERTP